MASPTVSAMSNKNGNDSVVSGSNGTFILNNTSIYTTYPVKAIVVLQDTVFSTIRHEGNAGNVLSTYVAATATAVKAGAIITPLENKKFINIQLTSGSVALVL
jgi:hypothetical protein